MNVVVYCICSQFSKVFSFVKAYNKQTRHKDADVPPMPTHNMLNELARKIHGFVVVNLSAAHNQIRRSTY